MSRTEDPEPEWLVLDEAGEVVDTALTFESAVETVAEFEDVAELTIRYRPTEEEAWH